MVVTVALIARALVSVSGVTGLVAVAVVSVVLVVVDVVEVPVLPVAEVVVWVGVKALVWWLLVPASLLVSVVRVIVV